MAKSTPVRRRLVIGFWDTLSRSHETECLIGLLLSQTCLIDWEAWKTPPLTRRAEPLGNPERGRPKSSKRRATAGSPTSGSPSVLASGEPRFTATGRSSTTCSSMRSRRWTRRSSGPARMSRCASGWRLSLSYAAAMFASTHDAAPHRRSRRSRARATRPWPRYVRRSGAAPTIALAAGSPKARTDGESTHTPDTTDLGRLAPRAADVPRPHTTPRQSTTPSSASVIDHALPSPKRRKT